MTHYFELTFDDFFERFYDAGQEETAKKVWEMMTEQAPVDHNIEDQFDEWDTEISDMKDEAEQTIKEEEEQK